MSQRTRAGYKAAKNSTYTTNGTGAIAGVNDRNMHEDVADSFFNLLDDKFQGAGGILSGAYTIPTLKAIATASLTAGPPGVLIAMRDTSSSNLLRVYELCTGIDAEAVPGILRPNDFDISLNQKVWKAASITAAVSTPSIVSDLRTVATAGGAMNVGQYQITKFLGGTSPYPLCKTTFLYELISSPNAEKWPYIVKPNDFDPSSNAVMWRCTSIANSLQDNIYSASHGFVAGDVLDNNYAKVASSSTPPAGIVVYVQDSNNYTIARGGLFYLQTSSSSSYSTGINYVQPNGSLSSVPSNFPFINIFEVINMLTGNYIYSGIFLANIPPVPVGNKIFLNENFI